MKNRRGELTTQQIVLLVIVIASFAIILFLFFRLNFGEETDKELCRNSVILRSGSLTPSETVSLKCQTSYVCLTEDGSCESMTNPQIEKVKSKEEIYQILADEMADCWWMFGEGRVDYIGTGMTKNNYCSICSQLGFDDSLSDLDDVSETLSKDELYGYLTETKISREKGTYAEYLFGTNNIDALKADVTQKEGIQGEGTFGDLDLKNQHYVLMGITSEIGNTYKWIGGIGAVAGIIIAATPVGWVGEIIIIGSIAIGAGGEMVAENLEPEILALTVKGKGIPNEFLAPTIIEANSAKFDALDCEEVKTLA